MRRRPDHRPTPADGGRPSRDGATTPCVVCGAALVTVRKSDWDFPITPEKLSWRHPPTTRAVEVATEYVWVLPRAFLPGRQRAEPAAFHAYLGAAAKTTCGEPVRRYNGYWFLVRLRVEVEAIARPCSRCYA